MNQKRVGEGLAITPLMFSAVQECFIPALESVENVDCPMPYEAPNTRLAAPAKPFPVVTTLFLSGILASVATANPMFLILSVVPLLKRFSTSKQPNELVRLGAQPKEPAPYPKRIREYSRTVTYFHLEEKEVSYE
jgi:hypothetical protein